MNPRNRGPRDGAWWGLQVALVRRPPRGRWHGLPARLAAAEGLLRRLHNIGHSRTRLTGTAAPRLRGAHVTHPPRRHDVGIHRKLVLRGGRGPGGWSRRERVSSVPRRRVLRRGRRGPATRSGTVARRHRGLRGGQGLALGGDHDHFAAPGIRDAVAGRRGLWHRMPPRQQPRLRVHPDPHRLSARPQRAVATARALQRDLGVGCGLRAAGLRGRPERNAA